MRAIAHRIFFVLTWLLATAWVCTAIRLFMKDAYKEGLLCGFFSWGVIFAILTYNTRPRPLDIQPDDTGDDCVQD